MRDQTNQYSLFVKINGQRVEEFIDRQHNIFVEGRQGTEYELEIVNNSHEKIMAVVSVDQLNVLNGQPADYSKDDGYVLNAYQSVTIPGWTLDNNNVAKFGFSRKEGSYNAKMGHSGVTGVIGMAIFREKRAYQPYYGGGMRSLSLSAHGGTFTSGLDSLPMNASVASVNAVADVQSKGFSEMGTAFGQETTFHTQTVTFEKRDANYPDALLTVFYDNQKGLERRGINIHEQKYEQTPSAFVTRSGCKPPPGWKN